MIPAMVLSLLLAFFSRVHSDAVLTQTDAATGRPGGTLRLTCKTSGFKLGSYYMHWLRYVPGQGLQWLVAYYSSSYKYYASDIESRFTASKDTSNNIFALDMTNMKTEDTAIYYCAKDYGNWGESFDFWGQGTTVTVAAVTTSPPTLYSLVSSCQQEDTYGSVTYGCLAVDYTPEITSLIWRKDGQLITTGVKTFPSVRNMKGTYTLSSELTIAESEERCSKISCEVQHSGSEKSIEMQCPRRNNFPPTVIVTVGSSKEITSSKFATMVCSIIDFYPKSMTVKWLKNGQSMDSGIVTSPAFKVNGNFSVTSRLTVSTGEWINNEVYTCEVTHQGVTKSQDISGFGGLSLCSDPIITLLPPPIEQVLLGATVTLTCIVSGALYGVNVSWAPNNKALDPKIATQRGEDLDSMVSKLNISTQAWLSGDEFYCTVSHQDLPSALKKSIRKEGAKNPLKPSVYLLLPSAQEVSAQRFISLSCLVRGFFPREIFVKWTINGKLLNPGNYKNTEVMAENGSSTFFMYSLLSIATEEWASGASYSCVVGHEALPLKIISRTLNKSSGKPSFVNISLALMDTVN